MHVVKNLQQLFAVIPVFGSRH